MQSKKKMIVNTVFLVVIFALTIYGVFHGEDLGAMMEAIQLYAIKHSMNWSIQK